MIYVTGYLDLDNHKITYTCRILKRNHIFFKNVEPVPHTSTGVSSVIISPNEQEAEMLMKSLGFREKYKEKLIVTNGKDGIIYYKNGENIFIKAPEVQTVDTMGAGSVLKEGCLY
ncbi:PfkB family carbohydrate kinase [Paenibacillus sp. FSL R5-0475]|uniref:PfkB family carbohydrate kinase n=1 Tax=unclassified Paenibacillus TaxID=185978 RepID=UPI0030F8FA7C